MLVTVGRCRVFLSLPEARGAGTGGGAAAWWGAGGGAVEQVWVPGEPSGG